MPSTGETTSDRVTASDSANDGELIAQSRSGRYSLPSWKVWVKEITARKTPLALRKLLPARAEAALLWGCEGLEPETADCIQRLSSLRKKRRDDEPFDWNQVVKQWLDDTKQRSSSVEFALECLAWSHALPLLVTRLDEENWSSLLDTLLEISDQAESARPQLDALIEQLLAGELRLTLAYLFPEIATCAALGKQACKTLSTGLVELLDGEGMPHARHVPVMRYLLACWTRAMYLDGATGKGRITKPARLQFDWLCRQVLRWTRSNRSRIFGPVSDQAMEFDEMLQLAIELTDDRSDVELLKLLGKDKQPGREKDLPQPAEHSEWSESAVLRTDWSMKSSTLAVMYHHRGLSTELCSRGHVIWSGDSLPQVTRNNQLLAPTSDWEEVCWESDRDMDYIELEMELANNWRIQRQMLLARKDGFAFIADAVLGSSIVSIGYRQPIPLAPGVSMQEQCGNARSSLDELEVVGHSAAAGSLGMAYRCPWRRAERRAHRIGAATHGDRTLCALVRGPGA